ncbi:MAG: GNAT family N-acetyltransferase [Anaerolineales bacterium]|jgi:predicted N-acetyltransferase YhbS|nr:GNAT family N-acetyltransferase [Anaerolineales bacterium]MBX3006052.1 GNAT family N-acetyltransferase [Anaerolineales bacterium]
MPIIYKVNTPIDTETAIALYRASTLGERRPVDDAARMARMLQHANLTVSAWDGEKLVGIARSVTDWAYCCYLSDLAVDASQQRSGIGKQLIRETQAALEPDAKIILLAAPAAVGYYPRIGFEQHPSAWVLGARQELS